MAIHLKPPGDPHCTCTAVSGGTRGATTRGTPATHSLRNGGGIVKRPVGVFVR